MKSWIQENRLLTLLAGVLGVAAVVGVFLLLLQSGDGDSAADVIGPELDDLLDSESGAGSLRIRNLSGCDEIGVMVADFIAGKQPEEIGISLDFDNDEEVVLHECAWRFPEPAGQDQPRGTTTVRVWERHHTFHTRDAFISTFEAASDGSEHDYLIESGQLTGDFEDVVITKIARTGPFSAGKLGLYRYELYIWNHELPTAVTKLSINSDHEATNSNRPELLPEDPGDERAVEVLTSFFDPE